MCMSKVTVNHDTPSNLIVDGWKEFTGPNSSPRFNFVSNSVPLNKWIKASEIRPPQDIRASDGKRYRSGFHIFPTPPPGRAWQTRRVYYRAVTAEGYEGSDKAVIAQEMYVPSKPDAWPPLESAPKKRLMDRIRKKAGGTS